MFYDPFPVPVPAMTKDLPQRVGKRIRRAKGYYTKLMDGRRIWNMGDTLSFPHNPPIMAGVADVGGEFCVAAIMPHNPGRGLEYFYEVELCD